jgi:26S proteasome regulatory subunit N3
VEEKLYEQARNLISKSTFPETISNNQWSRYLYYSGRIKAIQLQYSDAQSSLLQALRKAPQYHAKGFRIQTQKLLALVELLMGDIPDRQIFSHSDYKNPLFPYFLIVQSVRAGNLKNFHHCVQKYHQLFNRDANYSLILRLRHNVIKFGLRNINLSYSRISLTDICQKLHLESVKETEYTVAKAIRDGVIDATIDHDHQFLQTKVFLLVL